MWIFTIDGFFSVVKDDYCAEWEVMVRARLRKDLVRLAKVVGLKGKDILRIDHADYRYRLKLPKDFWVSYLARKAEGIDYPNFKNTVPAKDHARHEAYMGCWAALRRWQEE